MGLSMAANVKRRIVSLCSAVSLTVVMGTACAVTSQGLTPVPATTPVPAADAKAQVAATATSVRQPQSFSGQMAYESVVLQVALGPRITGTPQNWKLGEQILAELSANGWVTETQVFTYHNTLVRNIIGAKGSGDIVILGAHYDTRRRADQDAQHPDQPVPGADDGGTGVGVLLELSRVLDVAKAGKQVRLVFFDAEDNGELDGWDWLVGSRYYANSLMITPTAVVVTDMIGDVKQEIYLETNSTSALKNQIWSVADSLGYGQYFIPLAKWNMTDDHTPFLERGWPAVDIIDFDYPYWHTTQDTPDKISPESLQRVGRTLQVWLEGNN
jgi:glutaminyl-peptide cyclotransferase